MTLPLLELARTNTALTGRALRHARRLVASWQLLADLCFSDLVLLAPVGGQEAHRFVVLAHVRPTTGQTLYPSDLVGTVVDEIDRPVIRRAWTGGEIVGDEVTALDGDERIRAQCIPVRHRGELLGIVSRESATTLGRRRGELERRYSEVFDRLATMIADGVFPFARDVVEPEDAPRVADGVIVLDDSLHVRFASPNAISSLHRMGIHAYAQGMRLAEIGFDQHAAEAACRTRTPVIEEMERGDTSMLLQAVPLLTGEQVTGVLLVVRDVTDLRRRDRILMSKDATIREIHHRVKNNLQTIAAVLRLQRRRLTSEEARRAIGESERRIRSIAIVHETLSRDVGDVVSFAQIIDPLVRVIEEAVSTPELRLRFEVEGDAGLLPGEIVTPLAVVLNELIQNAVDHGFPQNTDGVVEGRVRVHLARERGDLAVDVVDDGVGLPAGFSFDEARGLGLSIVHALVTGELGGSIELRDEGGTRAQVRIPLRGSDTDETDELYL